MTAWKVWPLIFGRTSRQSPQTTSFSFSLYRPTRTGPPPRPPLRPLLAQGPEPPVAAVDRAGLGVQLLHQVGEAALADRPDLPQVAAGDPEVGRRLVPGLAPQMVESFHRFPRPARRRLDRPHDLPDDGPQLGREEVLAVDVLGQLPRHDVVQVHDVDGDLPPPEEFHGFEAPAAGDEPAVGGDDDRVQQADRLQGLGQGAEVAQLPAEPLADLDALDGPVRHGKGPWVRAGCHQGPVVLPRVLLGEVGRVVGGPRPPPHLGADSPGAGRPPPAQAAPGEGRLPGLRGHCTAGARGGDNGPATSRPPPRLTGFVGKRVVARPQSSTGRHPISPASPPRPSHEPARHPLVVQPRAKDRGGGNPGPRQGLPET
jgi:hypothetical protein